MPHSDELKRDIVIAKFHRKLLSYQTWDDLVEALKALTKAKIKNFLKAALAEENTNMGTEGDRLDTLIADNTALDTEIDTW